MTKVLQTRVREGVLEGLIEDEHGKREWRTPSNVTVEIVNDRTGEQVEVSDVKLSEAMTCE